MEKNKKAIRRLPNLFRKNRLYWLCSLFLIIELFFPLLISNYWTLRIIMFANIFVIYATSYDLLAGYGGLISFGHSIFFGGAGYLAGLLSLHLGLPLIVCIVAGCIASLIFGSLLGYTCLRLKGPYLAVVTLICPLILITVVHISPTFLGGDSGISGFSQLAGGSLHGQFYIVLLLTAVSLLIILRLAQGNFGLLLKTIRENEMGSEAAGVNTTKYKVLAFVISGVFAGLGGTLYVLIMGSIAPNTLSPHFSMLPIVMIYLGGASSIFGPAIGAYILTFLDLYLLNFPYVRVIIYAVVIILVLRLFPGGLMAIPMEIRRFKKWLYST
ncbi:MAG: branched-chain amino acid ABC transporter permease [Thermodesulfobacteriota bacterium]